MGFNSSKGRNGASVWTMQHLAGCQLPWPVNISPMKEPPKQSVARGAEERKSVRSQLLWERAFQAGIVGTKSEESSEY